MRSVAEDRKPYLDAFARLEKEEPGNGRAWVAPIRRAAIDRFAERGFPTQKEEAWRCTSVQPIARAAFLRDGAFVFVPAGAVVEEPIHLLFVSTAEERPTVSHPRALVVAGDASQATIVESFVGIRDDLYFTNAVTEIVAGAGSVLD